MVYDMRLRAECAFGYSSLRGHVYASAVVNVLEEAWGTHAAYREVHVAKLISIPDVKASCCVSRVEAGCDARTPCSCDGNVLGVIGETCCLEHRLERAGLRGSESLVLVDLGAVERALWHHGRSCGFIVMDWTAPLYRRDITVGINAG